MRDDEEEAEKERRKGVNDEDKGYESGRWRTSKMKIRGKLVIKNKSGREGKGECKEWEREREREIAEKKMVKDKKMKQKKIGMLWHR